MGTLEDGHCMRRAPGKLWGKEPGQVIRKLEEGSAHVVRHGGKLKLEYTELNGMPPYRTDLARHKA